METTGKRVKKEEVYYFAKEVEKFLELLNGTCIQSESRYILKEIEKQKDKLENLVSDYKPNIYEEYSMRTKKAYENMIAAKNEYERVVKEKCMLEIIKERKLRYRDFVLEYQKLKSFRDRLKDELNFK